MGSSKQNSNNHQENKRFLSRLYASKGEFLKQYEKLYSDKKKSKQLYFQILLELKKSISEGSIENFKHFSNLLDYINLSENHLDLISYYDDDSNPFKNTNLIILACKHNNVEVLKYIFDNYSTILNNLNTKTTILPDDEDETFHTAFYYAIRSNNVGILETLIEKWPGNYFTTHLEKLDEILSRAYEELKLKNVRLSKEVEIFIENKLINLRFFSNDTNKVQNNKISSDCIKERINTVLKSISSLNTILIVDDKFLFTVKFIAQNISILKQQLKSTYDRLPWEEIEFCLVSFITSYIKKQNINLFYKATLNKNKILKHLTNFAKRLEDEINSIFSININKLSALPKINRDDNVNQIINNSPQFEELYIDYQDIRDVNSLEKIGNYMKLASLANPKEKEGQLIITRCLQIIGEYLKNTLESPKLSTFTSEFLLLSLPNYTRKIVIAVRDSSSHIYYVIRRIESDVNEYTDYFINIQHDINRVTSLIKYILDKSIVKIIKKLLRRIIKCENLNELKEIAMIFNEFSLDTIISKHENTLLYMKLEKLIGELKHHIVEESECETQIFKDISDIIISEKDKLKNKNTNNYLTSWILNYLHLSLLDFDINSKDFKTTKHYVRNLLENMESTIEPNLLKKIIVLTSEISRENLMKIKCSNLNEINKIIYQIFHLAKFEIDDVRWIHKLNKNISKNSIFIEIKQTNNVSEENYSNLLSIKLSELKDILIKYALNNSPKSSYFKTSDKLRATLEILVLDILSNFETSKNYLENNLLFLDDNTPLLIGKCLLNHLEHDNSLNDVLLFNPSTLITLNAKKMSEENFMKTKRKIGRSIREDSVKFKSRYNQGLVTILNQEKMYSALEEGNLELLKNCIAKGAEINGRNINLWTPLHFAAKGNSFDVVKFLLDNKLNVNAKDISGKNPLHIAAAHGSKNIIQLFLKEKCSCINDKDDDDKTPLHYAAQNGHKDAVDLLLKYRAYINLKDKLGYSPLHLAVRHNHKDVVITLLNKELDVDCVGIGGFTLLHIASDKGHLDLVKHLLKLKANVCIKSDVGATALHLAALKGQLEVVRILISNGSDVQAKDKHGCTSLHQASEYGYKDIVNILLENRADPNICDNYSNTALHYSLRKDDHVEIVELLLKNGAKVSAVNVNDLTPLNLAIKNGRLKSVNVLLKYDTSIINKNNLFLHTAINHGHTEIVKLLVNHKLDVNIKNEDNLTPLHLACLSGHVDIVNFLIKNGATVNVKDNNGFTPLHAAVMSGVKEIVDTLIQNRAEIKARTNDGTTPIHLAARIGNTGIVKLLIKSKSNLNVTDNNGLKPLHIAAQHCNKDVTELLIKNMANVNASDHAAMTPLHLAVETDCKDIVEILLANKAVVNTKNKYNETPLSSAIKCNKEIAEILIANGADVNAEGSQPLLYAVLSGNKDMVQILLRNKARIDIKYVNNMTLLHIASTKCYKDIANLLITKGINVNCKDINGVMPLHIAAEKGNEELVEMLISNGAHLNAKISEGLTPLHIAATEGHIEIIKILLRCGVDVNTKDDENRTPLELATAFGHLKIVKYLLGVKETNVNYKGINNFTLLHIAAYGGYLEITRHLLECGADGHAKNISGSKPIHIAAKEGHKDIVELFVNHGLSVDEVGTGNRSLLHYAATSGQIKVGEYLIQQGASINFKDYNQATPIHKAASYGDKNFVELLLEKGAVYNAVDIANRKPANVSENKAIIHLLTVTEALFDYVRHNKPLEVQNCIKNGAVVNAKTAENVAPLHYAAWKGYDEIVDILLQNKGNPNIIGKQGHTPLHYAVKFSHMKVVRLLLANGAIYDAVSDVRKTPLDMAEDKSIVNLLKLLNELFSNVETGNIKVINDLKKIKDFETMKAIEGAVNRANKTLITFATLTNYPKLDQLKEILLDDLSEYIEQAEMLILEDKHQEALNIFREVIKKRKKMSKMNHPNTLDIQNRIAKMLYNLERYQEALNILEEICPKQKTMLGENHKDTLNTRSTIALILFKLGKNKEALKIYEEVHEKQKEFLGRNDMCILDTHFNMAVVLESLHKYDEALDIFSEIYEKQKKELGPHHTGTLTTLNRIATILHQQGKYYDSLTTYRDIYEARKTALGPSHTDTLEILHKIIAVHVHQKDHNEVVKAYRELLEIQKATFGQNHAYTVNTRQNIAQTLLSQGNYSEALKIFKECLEPRITILGHDHPEIINTKQVMNKIELRLQLDESIENVLDSLKKDMQTATVLQNLLRNVDNINEKDNDGKTLLHLATNLGRIGIVNKLLESGADANATTNDGHTSLHLATAKGSKDVVEALLKHTNRDDITEFVNSKINDSGDTALHIAAKNDNFEIVKSLLKHGAMYDLENTDGKTPLVLSKDWNVIDLLKLLDELFKDAENGDTNMVIIIQALNIDQFTAVTNARNKEGLSLIQVAISNKHLQLSKELLKIIIN